MGPLADALRYEWVRIRTIRSTWVLSALSVLVTGLIAALVAHNATARVGPGDAAMAYTAAASFTPIFAGLLGAFAFGHEYRYGTIRATLTAAPVRGAVIAAKVIVVLAWSAVLAIVCNVAAWLMVVIFGGAGYDRLSVTDAPVPRMMAGVVVYVALWGLFGLVYGGLFRSVPVAVTLLLVIPLVAESLIRVLLNLRFLHSIQHLGEYLPFTAGAQLYAYDPTSAATGTPDAFTTTLSASVGGLTMAVWAVALLALTWTLFERRDA